MCRPGSWDDAVAPKAIGTHSASSNAPGWALCLVRAAAVLIAGYCLFALLFTSDWTLLNARLLQSLFPKLLCFQPSSCAASGECLARYCGHILHDLKLSNTSCVLAGLTFTIPAGHSCGVVGRTGSGKSTLMLTLFRLIDVTHGAILLDGVDTSKIGTLGSRSRFELCRWITARCKPRMAQPALRVPSLGSPCVCRALGAAQRVSRCQMATACFDCSTQPIITVRQLQHSAGAGGEGSGSNCDNVS